MSSVQHQLKAALDLHGRGDLLAAERAYREILSHQPAQGDALNLLGVVLHQLGRSAEAVPLLREAVARLPGFADAHSNLAMACLAIGQPEAAELAALAALRLAPMHFQAAYFLGEARFRRGNPAAAAEVYRALLGRQEDWLPALHGLAYAERGLGNDLRSAELFARLCALSPDNAAYQHEYGQSLRVLGRSAEALPFFARAAALEPAAIDHPLALAETQAEDGQLLAARDAYLALAERVPENPAVWNGLGHVWISAGFPERGLPCLERACRLSPGDSAMHSARLGVLNYSPDLSADERFAAHREWGAKFFASSTVLQAVRGIEHKAAARCRVAFLSADLRRHSVASFLLSFLPFVERRTFELFAYADSAFPDEVTAQLRTQFEHWQDCAHLDDAALGERIRQDGIDLLIELGGHTSGNRLPVMALRPARVQASWIGYPDTTGLPGIDFRLTDAEADPLGVADQWVCESLLRLQGGFLCYAPSSLDVPVERRVSSEARVFGSFNQQAKINAQVIALWSELLLEFAETRLLIKNFALRDPLLRQELVERFGAHGIVAERLDLRPPESDPVDHLASYNEIDIALDSFPYCGTTTTCEALWMGVPVITLSGDSHAGRVGRSLLSTLGRPEWIAADRADYIGIARALPPQSTEMRLSLRDQFLRSPLTDGAAFAHKLEQLWLSILD